jgi:sialate O-acetylesterase
VKVQADKQTGAFDFDLRVPAAGGPYTLTFDDGKKTVLDNVMAGEVWFCSGQSNMEMPVKGWGQVNNWEQEVANANHPLVRLFQVDRAVAHTPQTRVPIGHTKGWAVCSPAMVEEFSACAYFFAREVSQKLGIAVGVVNSSWGGTPAESWTSHEALAEVTGFEDHQKRVFETGFDEEKIQQLYLAERAEWMKEIFGDDRGLKDGDLTQAPWAQGDFDDSKWQKMSQPIHWNQTPELKEFDGIVWLRRVIDIPTPLAVKDLKLELGPIDDEDCTYWNGTLVGTTTGWNISRHYTIPAHLLKPGRNILAVRIYDTSGDGGFCGDAKDFYLKSDDTTIPLTGDWSWQKSMSAAEVKAHSGGVEPKKPNDSWYPANLFNAMVAPFLDMPVRGFTWYQGCSNVGRAVQYESLFQRMILDWQARFNRTSEVGAYPKPQQDERRRGFFGMQDSKAIPFYFVQIANYRWEKDIQPESEWAAIREAQRKAMQLDGVGMMVNIDIGMAMDIHPKHKQEVGRRLALLALNRTYGREEACAAPEYYQMRVSDGKATLFFRPVQGSDALAENADIKGFTIAGPDHIWHVAKARVEGERFMQRVIVECPEVPYPVAVRYAWADNPPCNLKTISGLPVGPFRTDDWADFK